VKDEILQFREMEAKMLKRIETAEHQRLDKYYTQVSHVDNLVRENRRDIKEVYER